MAEDHVQRNTLKEFLASIATIRGDLSNISAPPFVLADKSTTEFPRYWIEHPALFCAPAQESKPERRILAVLKWFLASLKGQQYAGREPSEGTKKPLNAFLGEIFVGECGSSDDPTTLVSEQVSHHPPVTACFLENQKAGIRAQGFTRQEISFTGGSISIQQIGYALLHIDAYDEDYLIPLPNVRVKGLLTGGPYPELTEPCLIVGSNGLMAHVDFSGKGILGFGGHKNYVEAYICRIDEKDHDHPLFRVEGSWIESFEFKDREGKVFDTYDVTAAPATKFRTEPLEKQDPWESRKAWNGVISAISKGNMQGVADEKTKLEKAQREMRKQSKTSEEKWQSLFFQKEQSDPTAEKLMGLVGIKFDVKDTRGIWKFDNKRAETIQRPWRGELTPHG